VAAPLVAAVLAVSGCGDDRAIPTPSGPLAQALTEIGGGGANGSLGVGWADPGLLDRAGLGVRLAADALGPNADTVIEGAARLRRRLEFDPLSATRYLSVGGSYAFGLRLDGVDGRGLARALVEAGGRSRRAGPLELIEIGAYAVVPEPLLDADVNGVGAFDAFGKHLSVLAISDRARAALLGRGERLLDEPVYAAAASCLGDVVAARLIPDKLLLSTEVGIELAAIGVRSDGEVLCAVGGTPERSDAIAAALERRLAPTARDPVTGEPLDQVIADVAVSRASLGGTEVARAQLSWARRARPGYLLSAVSTGSLVSLINGETESSLP
jgi:hypothetical protein